MSVTFALKNPFKANEIEKEERKQSFFLNEKTIKKPHLIDLQISPEMI